MKMREFRERRASGNKVGHRQLGLLVELVEATGPAEVADLSADPSNARQSLWGLEKRGLVVARLVPLKAWITDRRSPRKYVYELTPAGRRLGQAEADRQQAESEAQLAKMTPTQRAEYEALMAKMRAAI